MPTRMLLGALFLAACGGSPKAPATAASGGSCPPAVTAAVTKAYPDATQKACEGEHEDGMDIFEVKLVMKDGSSAEVELSADGSILAMEEVVPASALPKAVADAFAAKYPGATAERVERITPTGKSVMFEIAFAGKEASFSDTGAFIEEEHADGDKDGDKNDKD
ncbi:MAG: PepSY-like domain-containing protein [Polyangiales bacterium]